MLVLLLLLLPRRSGLARRVYCALSCLFCVLFLPRSERRRRYIVQRRAEQLFTYPTSFSCRIAASLVTRQLRLPRLRLSRFGAYPIICRWAAAEC